MAIDGSTRAAVLLAWACKCFYCGREANCVDHVVPIKKGGTDGPQNLVASCRECNRAKGDLWLPPDALEEALTAAQHLAEFVEEAAETHRAGLRVAMDRINYGSVPLREGTRGQALVQPGERTMHAARDIATEADKITGRFQARKKVKMITTAQA